MKRTFPENTDPGFQRAYAQQVEAERSASRKQMIMAIAEGQARLEKKAEAREKAQRDFNRPPPDPNRPLDDFQQAAARLRAIDEAIAAIDAEAAAEALALERRMSARRKYIQVMARAKKVLADTAYLAASRRKK
jgi:hypothetical protein